MPNFLEQLAAEWYEFSGYFVKRNVNVGRRPQGGWECELDIVAFNPEKKHLVHFEPSMDADSWAKRNERFHKKFEAGEKHIPKLFEAFRPLPKIEPIAIFVFGSARDHPEVGGGRVLMIKDFMQTVRNRIKGKSVSTEAISEKYVILRALQFATEYWE